MLAILRKFRRWVDSQLEGGDIKVVERGKKKNGWDKLEFGVTCRV